MEPQNASARPGTPGPAASSVETSTNTPAPTPTGKRPMLVWLGSALIAILVVAASVMWYTGSFQKNTSTPLPTYFSYTQAELDSLQGKSSSRSISPDDLYNFDEIAFNVVARNTQEPDYAGEPSKVYAHLAVAQRDFAFLSHNTSGTFSGSIWPISKDVLCEFFPEDCSDIVADASNPDAYTTALTALVMSKIREHIQADKAGLRPSDIKTGAEYWDGRQPSVGIYNASSKGWFITSGSQFRAPPPPPVSSEEFAAQLREVQDILKNATPEQKRATVFWAGGPGTKTPPGQLLALGDDYMRAHNVPLEKVLLVRSVATMAIADAVTAVFDSKYTHFVRRPFMMDRTMITIMPTPNHPAYPSGHSTLSAAGTAVYKHYFPEDAAMWDQKALEAGMSRVWGGIHYMMDHEAGVAIGRSVGAAAIQKTAWSE